MKKYLLITVIYIFSSLLFAQVQTSPLKVGYIDSETILKALPESIKAQGEIESLIKKYQEISDSLMQIYQQSLAEYQQKSATMKENQKKETEQKIIKLEQSIREYRSKFERGGEVAQFQEKLLKPIIEKVTSMVEQVAKDEGMSFVFDKNSQIQTVVYADTQYDITYKVLDKLKRGK